MPTPALVDPTSPGLAGLYYRTDRLTEAGWIEERQARAALERHCAFCGTLNAGHGFGDYLRRPGILTCSDPDCMDQGRAWAAERDRVERETVPAGEAAGRASVARSGAIADLFGEAA